MAEHRDLPGWPKKKLVNDVRRHLWSYGIRPTSIRLWQETWAWAHRITRSYVYPHWPLVSEISAQYVVLLLCEMKNNRNLKLPFRAKQFLPESLRQMIGENSLPMIELKLIGDETNNTTVSPALPLVTEGGDCKTPISEAGKS